MYQAHRNDPSRVAVKVVVDFLASLFVFLLMCAAILGALFLLSA